MNDAIVVTLLGMGIVFVVLYILVLVLSTMKKVLGTNLMPGFYQKPAVKKIVETPKDEIRPLKSGVGDETMAVITAAITAYMGTDEYRIKNISGAAGFVVKPLKRAGGENPWTAAGRIVNTINNKL